MKLSRFLDMLAIYGARIDRWPDGAAARGLLEQSPEARAALAEAARVDGALDGFAPRVDDAAVARLRGTLQRRVARLPSAEAAGSRPWSARHMLLNLSLRFGALAAMAAVGVWIGFAQPMPSRFDQASVDPLAPIQVYAVPDDSP
jgi:hypothetical protein